MSIPVNCPSCNTKLIWKGVDICCPNINCNAQQLLKVASFLADCGVENVSETSLENWGITNFKRLMNFKVDSNLKSQVGFMQELNNKVFNKNVFELFSCMVFDGAGKKTITKILDFYGKGNIQLATKELYEYPVTKFPEGIAYKTIAKIEENWLDNLKILAHITTDVRYKPVDKAVVNTSKTLCNKTFCITGTLTKGRKYFEDLVTTNGGTISSVSKTLNYLLVGTDAGSKLEKAKKLGIIIITENEFINLIKE
jgi:DNA ligase (NAD+)